jgi:hypothetical protein
MKNIIELHANGEFCGIGNEGITKLNLVKLYIWNNPKITNVNHMYNLKILYAAGSKCGISNEGIKNINVEQLSAANNPKITNINHMDKLIELDIRFSCGINHEEIKSLKNLVKIYK